jgi:hypothetical protein
VSPDRAQQRPRHEGPRDSLGRDRVQEQLGIQVLIVEEHAARPAKHSMDRASESRSRPAALSSSPAASARRWSNAICPRSCSSSAVRRASSGPASTVTRSPRAASSAPASRLAPAVASRRCVRRGASGVSISARSRKALTERRLAHTGLAAHYQGSALAAADGVDQPVRIASSRRRPLSSAARPRMTGSSPICPAAEVTPLPASRRDV